MASQLLPEAFLEKVAQRFKALGDPLRLKLLNNLGEHGEMCVMELVEATGQQQANISKHLAVMTREGLLRRRKSGLKVYYSIDDPSIHGLCLLVCGRLREEGMNV
ncbi:MAG: helix-turn-helix transcriptional regulator [Deferribacteres bacterium]|nr:helix-turn-helix transcriptional regulator [candidate division KSB1 bacterium]MCB9512128.1 helix-turn-helix transcriptional regulator [Deferribacteres bacterium]